ncbi:MAG: triose-phosphate isomerase [Thauera phenolivorans]|uniref:Triosephosphate isomerase n=1 Tax=Thauera phenolivorans TaxID=1792543 RepID=A0A7X7LZ85_9RHOO|nr:triose-phosphate isomerase [Thauera phenolivorans]NLF55968.1 triose-phosphate isomerase [Thauera phenolivorans]
MRKKLVAGNWKMNGSLAGNRKLLDALAPVDGVDIAVCVPYPYLAQAAEKLDGIDLGVQDVSEFTAGAYTGEVSAVMVAEFGCAYAIVGHSERRALFREGEAEIGRKAAAALAQGLVPIVCIGETLAEREAERVVAVIERQLAPVLEILGAEGLATAVLAYEPVWAIGTGRSATVAQVAETHAAIRAWLASHGVASERVKILYGGSVKADNARELFALDDVDGGLIGGASLIAEEFLAICRAAAVAQSCIE